MGTTELFGDKLLRVGKNSFVRFKKLNNTRRDTKSRSEFYARTPRA
jgi:hypothetical protein